MNFIIISVENFQLILLMYITVHICRLAVEAYPSKSISLESYINKAADMRNQIFVLWEDAVNTL